MSSSVMTTVFVQLPGGNKVPVKLEPEQTLQSGLEGILNGQDRQLLQEGKLVLHTPGGLTLRPDRFQGRDLTSGEEYSIVMDPLRTVG